MRRLQPYTEQGTLKGVRHKVNVTRHCKRYYVTNMTKNRITSWQIVKKYRARYKIEVLFPNLKLCYLEECQGQKKQLRKGTMCMYACINTVRRTT